VTITVPPLSSPMAFDLETVPHPDMMDKLPPVKVPDNYKDEEKIASKKLELEAGQIDKMALNGTTALIVCCSFAGYTKDGELWSDAILYDSEPLADTAPLGPEAKFLNEIWMVLEQSTEFITYNGKGFDIPVILRRCLMCGIRTRVDITQRKYAIPPNGNHYDMLDILSHGGAVHVGSLGYISDVVLGESKTEGISGSEVSDYWNAGRHDDIAEYAKQDSILALGLWRTAKEIYWQDQSIHSVSDGLDTDNI